MRGGFVERWLLLKWLLLGGIFVERRLLLRGSCCRELAAIDSWVLLRGGFYSEKTVVERCLLLSGGCC